MRDLRKRVRATIREGEQARRREALLERRLRRAATARRMLEEARLAIDRGDVDRARALMADAGKSIEPPAALAPVVRVGHPGLLSAGRSRSGGRPPGRPSRSSSRGGDSGDSDLGDEPAGHRPSRRKGAAA